MFWIGSKFEEEIIVPFLQDITTSETYVTNSLWIDTEIAVGETTLQVRGSTDPAIVTSEADPLLLTEIKTTSSLDQLSEPKEHHRAQIHAYLCALNDKYEHVIRTGVIVYGCRKTLDIEVFHVKFDPEFWDDVVTWMVEQTEYEQAGELPPASPEREWECSYCSFKERCGKGDAPFSNVGYEGLLPLFDGYDQQNLTEYLEAHKDRDARLTPTLARIYPALAEEYGVFDWSCPRCSKTYAWDTVDWDGDTSNPPLCPVCIRNNNLVTLSGPEPNTQLRNDQD
ncbi:Dna2/Cas4 domain-containing protein [Halorubrum sp. ASP1]|nr:Dna2/Cas4 domain-containing protein [Halorubrum sp. ASP1]